MSNKWVGLVLSAGMFSLLAGCDAHSKKEHYYLISTNIKLPYWQTARAGFEKAGSVYGVSTEMRGPETFDAAGEVAEFRAVTAMKPAGILVSVANAALLVPEIDAAVAAGIPVITIDSDAPASHRMYFIGTNNLEAGRLGGQRVAAQLKGKGNVVFFTIAGQPNLEERLKGYKDVLAAYPGIKVAEVFDMKGDSGTAMDKAAEYLGRTGAAKIDAMVCLEASAGKDVGEALKRASATGGGGRLLVAMDTDDATLKLVDDGTIDSTISQKPYTMALLGLKGLDEMHHYPGKSADYGLDSSSRFPAFVDTGVSLVDKSNVKAMLSRAADGGAGSK